MQRSGLRGATFLAAAVALASAAWAATLPPTPSTPATLPTAPASSTPPLGAPGRTAEPGGASAALGSIVAAIRSEQAVPALAGALWDSGKLVGIAAEGVRCHGAPENVGVEDRWHIGSCTKAMTATLCAILVAEGSISWSTTLEDALPELAGRMRPEFRAVTLRELLAMRGRVAAHPSNAAWAEAWSGGGTAVEARQRFVERALVEGEPLAAGVFEYSNTSYAIVGHLCERAANREFEALLLEKLARPLGITTLGFGAPPSGNPCGHAAEPPAREGDGTERRLRAVAPGPLGDNPPAIAPAGRVHLSLGDWLRFLAAHADGQRSGCAALGLDAEMFRFLHAEIPSTSQGDAPSPARRYALGWAIADAPPAGPILMHDGSNTMWYACAWVEPETRRVVVAACNAGGDAGERAAKALRDRLRRLRADDR
ncbi:MAG TPA: serine hydrolase domain-containing protein [Phycisphaerales bacterium]|nr:serine hydrolase domain-containing protein [Phycisphaerales bacterium]HMP38358.1 serine hydrolase domain-containing protein [Phycisphaerales bacterium]